ncbi:hypothetical protein ACTFIW_010321 [Dictyostelium discoideum]
MDAGSNRAVRHMFKTLFDKGLIYRCDYLVNWDSITGTALADDEVEHEERNGLLYTIRYPIADSTDELLVATTRPETLLGRYGWPICLLEPRFKALIVDLSKETLAETAFPSIEEKLSDVDSIEAFQYIQKVATEIRSIRGSMNIPHRLKKPERLRVEKELYKLKDLQEKTRMQLNIRQFIEKAPQKLVEKLQEALRLQEEEIHLLVT